MLLPFRGREPNVHGSELGVGVRCVTAERVTQVDCPVELRRGTYVAGHLIGPGQRHPEIEMRAKRTGLQRLQHAQRVGRIVLRQIGARQEHGRLRHKQASGMSLLEALQGGDRITRVPPGDGRLRSQVVRIV